MKRRPFALLEVMIGLTLVLGTSFFLIQAPFRDLKNERAWLFSLEENRVCQGKLYELEQQLSAEVELLPSSSTTAVEKQVAFSVRLSDTLQKHHSRTYLVWNSKGRGGHLVSLQEKGKEAPDHLFFYPEEKARAAPD